MNIAILPLSQVIQLMLFVTFLVMTYIRFDYIISEPFIS